MNKFRWLPPTLLIVSVFGLFSYSHYRVAGGGILNIIPSETMQIALSLILTLASLFVILVKSYGPKDKHWAYATIGTILGFWLRAPK